MLRGTDVSQMMTRVETVLARAARSAKGVGGVTHLAVDGDPDLGTANLRQPANIQIEFHSGSARPVVGPAIRLAKRAVRRSLRWYVQPIMEQQTRFNHAVLDLVERLRAQQEKLLELETRTLEEQVRRMEVGVDGLRADVEALASRSVPDDTSSSLPSTRRALQYRRFEDRHRGSAEDVRAMLAPYLPRFEGCRRVVDLGCGRGEFLSLLRERGIGGYGVDSDETMVEAARGQGLEVVLEDAISHLRSVEAGTIDGVFCSQVAEHLETPQLMALLDAAFRKLAAGGCIVMETPNPETLYVFASFFYMDVTHIRPLHPAALQWALEVTGFDEVQLERVMPVPEGTRLEQVDAELREERGWSAVARNVDRLNQVLFGPQNFAAIGTKP
ncbi:MAG: methyltransferase domain-containing protein [Actinomycetota bacterium]|nr:methyltransferase domain-containing protein [Actinomycetota bacterium]